MCETVKLITVVLSCMLYRQLAVNNLVIRCDDEFNGNDATSESTCHVSDATECNLFKGVGS